MEDDISMLVSQLIHKLYEQLVSRKNISSDPFSESLAPQPPISSPLPSHGTSLKLVEQYEALYRVRDHAIFAVNAYAGHMLSAIGLRHNHLLPIYRPPSEILSMIFKMTERSARNSFRPLEIRAPLNLAQVSKLWREVALDTPSLWAAIDVMNIRIAPTFLERSRSTPLEIVVASGGTYGGDEDESDNREQSEHLATELRSMKKAYSLRGVDPHAFLVPLLPHINRWQSLTLEGQGGRKLEGFLLPAVAPALTTFCALQLGYRAMPTLHPALFNEQLPSLNRLSLLGVGLPWELAPTALRGLRWLTLEGYSSNPADRAQLLDLLQGCPLLEFLRLHTEDPTRENNTEETPKITLHTCHRQLQHSA
ncbi:hypothetical protein BOTBODRAFT_175273 [Botryobasidium botryosum FD-172 SS1]|uniref:F-box domain-containing protein n=1 Tax=Botryobasidium botryosum (strain FD-172 SS1) TaxID=930990 RepID=A0A067MPT6_BOTB1|nr:hypothetical protein BOTBODRAFT_175273 [Botryobasidium botryosum FD-172 SS1]